MTRLSVTLFLITVLAFAVPATGITQTSRQEQKSARGGFITIGYGKLGIGPSVPTYLEEGSTAAPAMDNKWGMILIGGGYYVAGGNTQFEIDLYATREKYLKTTTGDLIGGGTYENERYIRNWCLMLRMRQRIISPFFISGGIGMFEEETDNHNNTMTGGNAWSRDYGAYTFGLDIRINRYLLVGIHRIWVSRSDLFGEYTDEIHPSREATLAEVVLLL